MKVLDFANDGGKVSFSFTGKRKTAITIFKSNNLEGWL